MAWLVTEGRVLASCEIADGRRERGRGLLGRDGIEGALVLDPCRWVHTIGMRFPLDVAYLDEDGVVVKTVHMRRHRVGVPVWRAHQRGRGPRRGIRPVGAAGRRRRGVARMTGTLVLVATPIGNLGDLSPRAVDTLRRAGTDPVRGHSPQRQAARRTPASAGCAWRCATSTPRSTGRARCWICWLRARPSP